MADKKSSESKSSQRMEVVLRVEYVEPKDILSDYITSLGEGGMFIHTSLPLQEGQTIFFTLSFPGLLDPFELKGVVRFRRDNDDDQPEGLGVEFLFADEAQRARLQQLLASFEEQSPAPRPSPTPYKVLLVEDNAFAMELFSYALTRFRDRSKGRIDLEVLHAADAYEAQRHFLANHVDLAIVDHYLPGMTGVELVKKMRQHEETRSVAILVVSSGGDAIRQQAYEAGADLFLDKPVLHKQLLGTIASLLARKEKR